ncbi:MAG: hypothetical protein H0U53_06120 [Actinobacteria bacterium]|nr:hypothetical protein [Actinomycetota bacterium]
MWYQSWTLGAASALRGALSTFAEFVGGTPASKTVCILRFRSSEQTYGGRPDYYKQLREFIPRA